MKKAKIKKIISTCLIATSMLTVLPISASAEWKELGKNKYGYIENDKLYNGWKLLDYTLLYKGNGLSEDNSAKKVWYYFDENGVMKVNSWVKSGDKWYYLKIDGSMATNCIENGYAIGADGAWIEGSGWRQLEYYGKHSRRSENENDPANKAWFYFDQNGLLKTNSWVETNGKWYYVRDDGSMATNCFIDGYPIDMFGAWISDGGWKKDDKGWWFSYGEGKGYPIEWKSFDDPLYDAYDYKNLTDGTTKYFFGRDGYMKTGWIQYDSKWYYLKDDGSMATNTTVDGYVIGDDGASIDRLGKFDWSEDIITVPQEYTYPLGTKTVKFDVVNNTGKIYQADYPYGRLEKYENGKWVEMQTTSSMEKIPDGMCIALPEPVLIRKVYSSELDLTEFNGFDSSEPGTYRISFGNPDSTHKFFEFEIK